MTAGRPGSRSFAPLTVAGQRRTSQRGALRAILNITGFAAYVRPIRGPDTATSALNSRNLTVLISACQRRRR